MAVWLLLACVPVTTAVLGLTGALRVRRYSRGHVVARLAVRGRGIFFSRTPDGDWWALRLRRRRCDGPASGEDPPDVGVREPRTPPGPRPASAAHMNLP